MSMMRRRLLDDTVRRTAEGESIVVRSVARMRPGLSIYGKSHQNTVAGNQLIPMTVGEEIVSKNGFVSAICTEDGVNVEANAGADNSGNSDIYFIGTGTTVNDYVAYPDFEAGKTYVVRCDSLNYILFVSALRDGAMVTLCYSDNVTGNGTFTPEEGDTFHVFLRPRKIYTEPENEVVHVMISSNMDAPIWEPYTGGQPSPNPDYPQEIVSVGDDGEIGVNVYGGNLLHLPDGNIGKYISISNDIITINSGARERFNFMQIPEMVFNPNKYTMSIVPLDNIENDGTFQFAFRISVDDKVNDYVVSSTGWYMGGVVQGTNGQDTIEITDKITAKYFNVDIVKGDFTGQRFKIILNIGSTALPYEPCKQPQSLIVSTPNGLPGIPVSSGGNYTDENGQQWISDEVDFKRGKYVQRVNIINSKLSDLDVFTSGGGFFGINGIDDMIRFSPLICNILKVGDTVNVNHTINSNRGGGYNPFFRINEGGDTVDTLNSIYGDKNFILYYQLETPIETDLTPEQITAYQSLHTNYPTTTVMDDSDAGMKLTYKTRKSLEVT